jgi:putative ABC transport system ATP-binding protein
MANETTFAVEAIGLNRIYGGGGLRLAALKDASLSVARGEVVAIMGPSGSGKSTLLYILAGLDLPDSGGVKLAGTDWKTHSDSERARFRRHNCGFIAQGMSLLPQATAAENVEVPLLLEGIAAVERGRRVSEALERVGVSQLAGSLTDELSGGEQQRVAIARALVLEPAVVLADEPTGSLDSVTAQTVTRLLVAAAPERGTAVIFVTHDPAVARHAHRIVTMNSGELT